MNKADIEFPRGGIDSGKIIRKIRENLKKRRGEHGDNVQNLASLERGEEHVVHGKSMSRNLVEYQGLIQRGLRKYIEPVFITPLELEAPSKKKRQKLQVHQLHPTAFCGDAIGNDMLEICRVLRSYGYNSDIYSKHIDPRLSKIVKDYHEYRKISSPDNILVVHYSTGYGQDIFDFIKSLPDKKVLIYHKTTPPRYFADYNDSLAALSQKGLEQITNFKGMVIAAWADSEYNRKELERFGFSRTDVLPIIMNFKKFRDLNRRIYEKFNDGKINIIFVGRIAPNKKIEDLILVFYYYYNYINTNSRLIIVGSDSGLETYHRKLNSLIKNMKLEGKVVFTGKVPDEDLSAYYRAATNFICMSEHEGFCIPIVEAMFFKIPVIAYNSTAVPYTLGNAGVLVNKKDYLEIAELINVINSDTKLKNALIRNQNARLTDFSHEKTTRKLVKLVNQVGRSK